MTAVLAIDQGTSGTKAIVIDGSRHVVSQVERPISPRYLADGGVEQDPGPLLDSVLDSGREALDLAALAGVQVDAVALANQGETVLAWDPNTGRPLSSAVVWQDRRSQSVLETLDVDADLMAERTGLVLDPYFSAPKMRWLRDHVTTEGTVTTTDTWLTHQLAGTFVTDVSTASRSLLLDLRTQQWDPELAAAFGLGDEDLPTLVASDDVVGTTDAFGPELPLTGLIVDQQAALLAEACLEPGSAKCTFGTGAFLLAQTGERVVRPESGLTTSVAWRLRGHAQLCVDGQVYTAASAVRWLTTLGLISSPSELDTVSSADSAGVLCVPALAGLAAPWWDSAATATWSGMTLSTDRGHLVRSVLEGIAAQVAQLIDVVGREAGTPLDRLRVDGGLTRSAVLMQAQADLAQIPVEVYPSPHATALGAGACARLALEPDLRPLDAVDGWSPAAVYEPRWSADRAADHLARWTRAAQTSLSTTPPEHT